MLSALFLPYTVCYLFVNKVHRLYYSYSTYSAGQCRSKLFSIYLLSKDFEFALHFLISIKSTRIIHCIYLLYTFS